MEPTLGGYIQKFADRYRAAAPEGWVRIVTWWTKLGDSRGEASLSATTSVAEAIVRRADGNLVQEPIRPKTPPVQDLLQIEPLQVGTPDEGWMLLKVEIEPDRVVRADFEQGEPLRTEGSLRSRWADEVHRYLDLHREELEQPGRPDEEPRRARNPFRR